MCKVWFAWVFHLMAVEWRWSPWAAVTLVAVDNTWQSYMNHRTKQRHYLFPKRFPPILLSSCPCWELVDGSLMYPGIYIISAYRLFVLELNFYSHPSHIHPQQLLCSHWETLRVWVCNGSPQNKETVLLFQLTLISWPGFKCIVSLKLYEELFCTLIISWEMSHQKG